ncbi:amidohydrolase family protein [Demequina sp. SYSU T00039]|uniref:Amidohydrolase family protein n=1 Tax=Demequina lignilytica TaxID=3051663 RepID=A0AAW7M6I4_9MICO|nr:amidohydrolase family protein [Demequina sp. SYSU T00039]MDN4486648.1 amidohydrolase family protein [Demequina sp. SYSU T00039]
MTRITFTRARPVGRDGEVAFAVEDGRIVAVDDPARPADHVVDLEGRWVMPGLWDRHVHFTQWARTWGRLDVSAASSAEEVCASVALAPPDGLLVGFGFRWATWEQPPTLDGLDAARAAPTVVLSGDLHTSWVNSAAARELGLPRAGVLREDEAFAAQRVLDAAPPAPEALAAVIAAAHARGLVGIVDLEMADNAAVWTERVQAGAPPLRVVAGFYRELLDSRIAQGATTGLGVPGTRGLVVHGPLKVITDGSLNTLTAHCRDPYPAGGHGIQNVPGEELARLLSRAHAGGIHAAVHAIGDRANTIALDAFAASGARGSIEHAQLLAEDDLPRFAALGVVASVQPEHALDDRDATDALWGDRADRAFALRSLLDAGARLALGSDAPVAPLDPWIAIAAAVARTRDGRAPWHPEQAITVVEALAASTRHDLSPGAPADLVALDQDPLAADGDALRRIPVALTTVAGAVVHDAR